MPTWLDLTPFALLGLLGAAHCAGMCGGFALTVAMGAGASRRSALGRLAAYNAGKALTYAVLGLALAQAVGLLTHAGAGVAAGDGPGHATWLAGARRAIAVVTGIAFVLLGLRALGVWRGAPRTAAPRFGARLLDPLARAARSLDGTAGAYGLGLVNGLLPCGLSWAALALAVGQPPAHAALGMLTFGLATVPVLLAVGMAGTALPAERRARLTRLAAPAFVLLGLATLARAGFGPRELTAECCSREFVEDAEQTLPQGDGAGAAVAVPTSADSRSTPASQGSEATR